MTFTRSKRALVILPVLLAGCKATMPADLDARLLDGCNAGDLAEVKDLIGKGADIRAKDRRGFDALDWAEIQAKNRKGAAVEVFKALKKTLGKA